MADVTAPKTFTLEGKALQCYQAGIHMGVSQAYSAASALLRQVKTRQSQDLIALRTAFIAKAGPLPDDHPLKIQIESLPTLAAGLETIAAQWMVESNKYQAMGNQIMGEVAAQDVIKDARWHPPWRAWGMLALAITIATVAATLASRYAISIGW